MDKAFRFNKDLIDGCGSDSDDSRLSQIGYYVLVAYNNTVVQAIYCGETCDVNQSLIDSCLPVTLNNVFKIIGLHETVANKDTIDSSNVQQSLEKLSLIIKNGYRVDQQQEQQQYIISFSTVCESEQEIKRSGISVYGLTKTAIATTKSLDQLTLISDPIKVGQEAIRAEIYKSNYLVSISTTTSIPLNLLKSHLESNGDTNSIYFTTSDKSIISNQQTNIKDWIKSPTKKEDTIIYPDINLNVLFKITANGSGNTSAPAVSVEKGITLLNLGENINTISMSTLCIIDKEAKTQDAITLFKQAIKTQINGQSNCKAFHFQLGFLPYPITTIYSKTSDGKVDDALTYNQRKQYHQLLDLPLTRAYLKTSLCDDLVNNKPNTTNNSKKQTSTQHLINVHKNLDLESKTDGSVYLVDGNYEYYHYLQDNMDDNGWGCAYRSMQTICSWLKLQNFTKKPVPTHLDIQKILVELQDKEQSFIKSKQWIGAFEITLCLDYLYNIECKILNISSGADVVYKSRELAKHFQVNKCPIMIGGGVLAYTLLGIDFNESTGETRYLILDPHYTGATDNIKLIKEKGWCGWKPASLFRKDAFYNFCMPQIKNDL
ncbi:hypothetical protein CYY_006008 [Polysphondylium violaceum]|uniref:UFSP1/2/DUB catalytic domain-containing protein n=1 Tax=Polysphondylium violaceum TaxID=133409 RepID=A0A8J4V6B9_9MYCE|nr:hypothetical protein CYY_006008 [Polysphondylium violaceum]